MKSYRTYTAATLLLGLATASPASATSIASVDPSSLYVVGTAANVGKAARGERTRACAPSVERLPGHFTHLRTPPRETGRAMAIGLCEVLVVPGDEVDMSLAMLDSAGLSAEVAPLSGGRALPAAQREQVREDAPLDTRMADRSSPAPSTAPSTLPP